MEYARFFFNLKYQSSHILISIYIEGLVPLDPFIVNWFVLVFTIKRAFICTKILSLSDQSNIFNVLVKTMLLFVKAD